MATGRISVYRQKEYIFLSIHPLILSTRTSFTVGNLPHLVFEQYTLSKIRCSLTFPSFTCAISIAFNSIGILLASSLVPVLRFPFSCLHDAAFMKYLIVRLFTSTLSAHGHRVAFSRQFATKYLYHCIHTSNHFTEMRSVYFSWTLRSETM